MDDSIDTSAEAAENAVLAGLGEVHSDPAERPPATDDLPAGPAGKSAARWAYERVILYIRNFEAQLDVRHEVAMGFAGGEAGVIRIEGLGYFEPDIVTFYGRDETGARTQLIQHVAQLNVMLRALPVAAPGEEPRRIGFRLASALASAPAERPGAGDSAGETG